MLFVCVLIESRDVSSLHREEERRGRDGFFLYIFIFLYWEHVSVDVVAQFLACDKEDFVFDP